MLDSFHLLCNTPRSAMVLPSILQTLILAAQQCLCFPCKACICLAAELLSDALQAHAIQQAAAAAADFRPLGVYERQCHLQ
jgi:hypothetical protein